MTVSELLCKHAICFGFASNNKNISNYGVRSPGNTEYKMVHTDSEWQIAQKVVEDALRNTDYACQGLERLPGGFINFAFRNRLARPIEGYGQTVVVKMTEDKLKIEKTTGEEFTLHKTRSVSHFHPLAYPLILTLLHSKFASPSIPSFLDSRLLANTGLYILSTMSITCLPTLYHPSVVKKRVMSLPLSWSGFQKCWITFPTITLKSSRIFQTP